MSEQIVYCSGPMFSVGDLWEQQNIAAVLEAGGFTTYLPQRDGLEVGKLMALLLDPQISSQEGQIALSIVRKVTYSLDIYQLIGRCTCLVFNMDGRVPDGGSLVESSIAYAAGKPIVIYKTTPITMLAGTDNPMIEGLSTSWTYVHDTVDIVPALQARIAAQSDADYVYTPPSVVGLVLEVGSSVADKNSKLRQILAAIAAAPTGPDALKEAKALLEWAKTDKAFQAAFGSGQTSFLGADGQHKLVSL
ncbi:MULTISPECIES: nucleoside 2-deoxyribosyltransferase [unclassified Ruegeria]|uniref:nucleoside 2-deoxyribosyltransferase n=1 Tax=unclassified Ruegeria TaxID=2625375 RepID=UPI001489CB49|nr:MULTISPECIES: nucleoside 2-deoxyribosyltransferase [unclassified Ruegeria]NOD88759.1 nucleoside 2-deoxyribosyltransferase [Ruegeria sp. HKCCD4318]NOE16154.1 nucleoside 2-deoxyribosyltransferase [Ruegeria sp. HKCCD4318-2]NOG09823.1 nucleoside 2-deoxyribosyltransferase [Ruegeria sp. HKCCD4315]